MTRLIGIRALIGQALFPVLGIYVLSRLLLLVISMCVITQGFSQPVREQPSELLCHWDCEWYVSIAAHGYSEVEQQPISVKGPGKTSYGFYPLYPILMRALMPLFGGSPLLAGIVLSNLCLLLALYYLYLYVQQLGYGHMTGLLAVCMTCVLPQSIVYSEPFTESLSMLLLAAAIFHCRQQQYLVAGIAAALLSATRSNGILFVFFVLVWLLEGGWRTHLKPWSDPTRYVPLMLAPLGAFAFFFFCYWSTGDAFAYNNSQRMGWGWVFGAPWTNLAAAPFNGGNYLLGAVTSVSVFCLSLALLRERLYAEFALCAGTVILICSGSGVPSVFRYWLVLFPLAAVWSHRLCARPLRLAVVMASIGLLNGAVTVAWTLGSEALL